MEGSWIALGVAAVAFYSLIGGAVYAVLVDIFEFNGSAEWGFLPVIYAAVWPITAVVIATWALLVMPARLGTLAAKRIIRAADRPPPDPSDKPTTF